MRENAGGNSGPPKTLRDPNFIFCDVFRRKIPIALLSRDLLMCLV